MTQRRTQVERWHGGAVALGTIATNTTRDIHREEAHLYTADVNLGVTLTLKLPYDVRNYCIGGPWVVVVLDGNLNGDIRVETNSGVLVRTLSGGPKKLKLFLLDTSTADGTWYAVATASGATVVPA